MPEKPALVLDRATLWGSFIVLLVALICVRLGFWQLQRLEQRRARNHASAAQMQLVPLQLVALSSDTTGLIFRRTILSGGYDDARTIIIAGRSLRGVPGVHVLTPLRRGAQAVLVNRGWMPSADAARIELDSILEPSPVDLTGLIMPFPEDYGRVKHEGFQRVWFQMDGDRLRSQFPYAILPVVVQILPHPGQPRFPIRLRPPEQDEGPHLGYAIQWFSFAGIAIIGWAALVLHRRRNPGRSSEARS